MSKPYREFPLIAEAVFNEPWLLDPAKMQAVVAVLQNAAINAETLEAAIVKSNPAKQPELQVVNGVPVIDVIGVISRRMNLFSAISGGTSIEMLDRQFSQAAAMNPPAIILNIDSHGGGVPGVPELASKIREACMSSPCRVIALANGTAASAAYWIGSQADEFYCTEAATVGSIGVIVSIVDDTRAMKNQGYDPTIIRSGELKAAGNGPLTPSQMQSIKGRVDQLFAMFCDAVRSARPQVDIAKASSGDVWIGKKAVEMGLCDGVTTLEKLLGQFAS